MVVVNFASWYMFPSTKEKWAPHDKTWYVAYTNGFVAICTGVERHAEDIWHTAYLADSDFFLTLLYKCSGKSKMPIF